jgi:hypothetical protein
LQNIVSGLCVVRAATGFLATLSEAQRQKVIYPYDDAAQRARWSNFPTSVVPRGGDQPEGDEFKQR